MCYETMKIDPDEPTVVFLIGFSSMEAINECIPGLLNGLTKINTSSTMDDIRIGSRFLLHPEKDQLLSLDKDCPCIHVITYARSMNKQVFVILDSIECICPPLQSVASHMICSASVCRPFFNQLCGIWINMDSNTFEQF